MVFDTELSINTRNWVAVSSSTKISLWNYELEPRRTANIEQKNKETAEHPRTELPRGGRNRSIIYSQKTWQGAVGVRKSLLSISYELDGLSRQGRSPNTHYYNLKLNANSIILQRSRRLQKKISKRKKTNKDIIV